MKWLIWPSILIYKKKWIMYILKSILSIKMLLNYLKILMFMIASNKIKYKYNKDIMMNHWLLYLTLLILKMYYKYNSSMMTWEYSILLVIFNLILRPIY